MPKNRGCMMLFSTLAFLNPNTLEVLRKPLWSWRSFLASIHRSTLMMKYITWLLLIPENTWLWGLKLGGTQKAYEITEFFRSKKRIWCMYMWHESRHKTVYGIKGTNRTRVRLWKREWESLGHGAQCLIHACTQIPLCSVVMYTMRMENVNDMKRKSKVDS